MPYLQVDVLTIPCGGRPLGGPGAIPAGPGGGPGGAPIGAGVPTTPGGPGGPTGPGGWPTGGPGCRSGCPMKPKSSPEEINPVLTYRTSYQLYLRQGDSTKHY